MNKVTFYTWWLRISAAPLEVKEVYFSEVREIYVKVKEIYELDV